MTRKITSELFPSFVKYTDEMYLGNAPRGKGHEHVNGGYCDRWSCKYGGGESYNGELIHASFSINHKVNVYICGSVLWITDIRYSGKTDVWEYSSNPKSLSMPVSSCVHKLEDDKIEMIFNTNIDCEFWKMVQKRAKAIYERK